MFLAPVLATPDFTKTFIVQFYALGNGIFVVLMQEGRSISFEIHRIKGKYLQKLIYEKVILEILDAFKQW